MDDKDYVGEAIYRVEVENGLDDFDTVVRGCRSYRRFDEGDPIGRPLLLTLVNLARRTGCAGNQQHLRYHVVSEAEERDVVAERLGWAAMLKDWAGPSDHERPTGYVIICSEKPTSNIRSIDVGIAAQTMLLAATDAGYGGCMLKNYKADLGDALGIDSGRYTVQLVVAFGKPAEKVVLEKAGADGSLAYWRDEDDVHHVPKLSLEGVLI